MVPSRTSVILAQPVRYAIAVPPTYDPSIPMPAVLHFHAWGDVASTATGMGGALASVLDALVVAVEGYDDRRSGTWQSWNGAGSTASTGPAGRTCLPYTSLLPNGHDMLTILTILTIPTILTALILLIIFTTHTTLTTLTALTILTRQDMLPRRRRLLLPVVRCV